MDLYMNRLLKHWRRQGKGEEFRARLVNYADDWVILSRGRAAEALQWTRQVNPHVRFDERETETEPWIGLRHRHSAKAAGQQLSPSPTATAPSIESTTDGIASIRNSRGSCP